MPSFVGGEKIAKWRQLLTVLPLPRYLFAVGRRVAFGVDGDKRVELLIQIDVESLMPPAKGHLLPKPVQKFRIRRKCYNNFVAIVTPTSG